MKLTVQKILPTAGIVVDVTPFLDETVTQTVTQELEINMFQRTMADVQVSLSDLSDTATDLFDGIRKVHLYEVSLYDDTGRRRFWGYIENPTVKFSLRDRMASFTAFSGLRRFWDTAKATKLSLPQYVPFGTTITLIEFMMYQAFFTNIRDNGTSFSGFELGEYATKTILGYGSTYKGEVANLSKETTWYDFLTALCLWYNAEIYIDPEDRSLKMVPRVSVLNDRQLDIDAVLCDDEDIDATAVEDKVVDWIEATGVTELPAPTLGGKPELLALEYYNNTKGLRGGTHLYRVMHWESGDMDGFLTNILEVYLDAVPSTARGWKVPVRIPDNPFGYGKRTLYRSDPTDPSGGWHRVVEVASATPFETVVYDDIGWGTLSQREGWPEKDIVPIAAWLSFDESTGEWEQRLDLPKGQNTPSGNIFKVYPDLKFLDPYDRSKELAADPRWAFQLFTGSVAFPYAVSAEMRTRWADIFRTRRVVNCKVTGIDYEVGDSVVSKKSFFPNDLTADKRLVIRKATCDLVENTSKLELVTV